MRRLTSYFIAGLVAMLPTAATIYVLGIVVRMLSSFGGKLQEYIGIRIPGLGAIITIILVMLLGLVTRNVFGRRIVAWYDSFLQRVPVVKPIYATVKQVLDVIANPGKSSFKKMVMIEWPSPGLWTIGYLVAEESIGGMASVFVPTPPNPAGGFVVLTTKDKYHVLDMSMEEGVKFILSCGVLSQGARESAGLGIHDGE